MAVDLVTKVTKANITLSAGDVPGHWIDITFHVKKTLRNRLKYKLFCFFFPFVIRRWTKED